LPFHGSNRGSNPLGDATSRLAAWVSGLRNAIRAARPCAKRHCPICGFNGWFVSFGIPLRSDALCPGCGSLERHRLFWCWLGVYGPTQLGDSVLHFAPEATLERRLRPLFPTYMSADMRGATDLSVNIERLALKNSSFSSVVCNHVLEHVNDRLALAELSRVLMPGGHLICSVPLVASWRQTYESDLHVTAAERELHFGQKDHVRYYGSDFIQRVSAAGFELVCEYQGSPDDCAKYSLVRGERLFVFCNSRVTA
jgi:SAM-dependent methyltransferase